jgi:16S rRNA (guanine527-N7)-methyltransferase
MDPAEALLSALDIPKAARDPLVRWLDLLRQWNARIDLTAARTDEELFDLMLADAAVLADRQHTLIPSNARVVDVGTGAGSPGLAMALLRPDLRMTLIEPLAKRIAFLRTVLGTLGRTDVELVRSRVEDVVEKRRGSWDIAVSRATLAPHRWVPVGLDLAPSVWVLLAREQPPSLDNTVIDCDLEYVWPLTKASRRAVRFAAR